MGGRCRHSRRRALLRRPRATVPGVSAVVFSAETPKSLASPTSYSRGREASVYLRMRGRPMLGHPRSGSSNRIISRHRYQASNLDPFLHSGPRSTRLRLAACDMPPWMRCHPHLAKALGAHHRRVPLASRRVPPPVRDSRQQSIFSTILTAIPTQHTANSRSKASFF